MESITLTEQTRQFFAHLWRGGSAAYWWYLDERSKAKTSHWFDTSGIAKVQPNETEHVYFGVHPTRQQRSEKQRSTIKTIAAINCLFAEFDGDISLETIEAIEPCPSVIIESSPGKYHAYWLLDAPFTLEGAEQRSQAQRLQQAWVAMVKGDNGAKDLARVLRVPGTRNIKAKYAPGYHTVQFVRCDLDMLYSIDELAAIAQPYMEKPKESNKPEQQNGVAHDLYAERVYRDEIARLALATEHKRNDTLFKVSVRLDEFVQAGRLPESVFQEVSRIAEQIGLDGKEISATITSARNGRGTPETRGMDNGTEPKARRVNPETGEVIKDDTLSQEESNPDIKEGINRAAEDFAEMFGHEWRYDEGMHCWRLWTGTHWKMSSPLYVASKFFEDGCYMGVLKNGKRKSLNSLGSVRDVLTLASDLCETTFNLNQHSHLLNVANGVIDLRTGKLQEHDKSYHFTYCIDVEYNPNAACPLWQNFVADIFNNDQSMINFVQRAAGYSITSNVSEQVLFFCYGSGKNGKSTFLNILYYLMGEFGMKISAEALLSSRFEKPAYELADLPGKRLVIASELESRAVNEAIIKDLTGDDIITARQIRSEPIRFQPTHKLWMYGNVEPIVRGTDDGIWRRFLKIPFTVSIPPERRDKDMKDKIIANELSGVLAWCVQGAVKWYQDGLQVPEVVNNASQEYRESMDVIGRFINECCATGEKNFNVEYKTLYTAYQMWCEDYGEVEYSRKTFSREIISRGYAVKPGSRNKKYCHGIRLLDINEKPQSVTSVTDVTDVIDHDRRACVALDNENNIHDHDSPHGGFIHNGNIGNIGNTLSIAPLDNGYAVVEKIDDEYYHYFEDERIFQSEQEARQAINGKE